MPSLRPEFTYLKNEDRNINIRGWYEIQCDNMYNVHITEREFFFLLQLCPGVPSDFSQKSLLPKIFGAVLINTLYTLSFQLVKQEPFVIIAELSYIQGL